MRMALINTSRSACLLTFGALGALIGVAPLFWAYAAALAARRLTNRHPARKTPSLVYAVVSTSPHPAPASDLLEPGGAAVPPWSPAERGASLDAALSHWTPGHGRLGSTATAR